MVSRDANLRYKSGLDTLQCLVLVGALALPFETVMVASMYCCSSSALRALLTTVGHVGGLCFKQLLLILPVSPKAELLSIKLITCTICIRAILWP